MVLLVRVVSDSEHPLGEGDGITSVIGKHMVEGIELHLTVYSGSDTTGVDHAL